MAGPFDVAIKQFLENLQTTPQAVETGFARQREERLVGEERDERERVRLEGIEREDRMRAEDFARDDELRAERVAREDDVDARNRENQLTDVATQARAEQLAQLRTNLAFLEPGTDLYERATRAINALARPSQMRGQQFLDHVIGGRVAVGPGEVINLHHLLGEMDSIARNAQLSEGWLDRLMQNTMEYITDTSVDAAARQGYVNSVVLNSNFFSTGQQDMLLASIIEDPDERRRVIAQGQLDEIAVRTGEAQLELMGIERKRGMLGIERELMFRDVEYETMQAALAGQVQQNRITDANAFREFGYVPTDEQALNELARSMGRTPEALRALGDRIWDRVQASEDLAVKGQAIANLHGDVLVAHAQFNLREEQRLSDINYDTAVANLRAIVRSGELSAVEAHRQYGYVPTDEDEAAELMRSMNYESPEEMRAAGNAIWTRLQRAEEAQLEALHLANAFGKVQNAQAIFNLEEGQRLATITYARAQEELRQLVQAGDMTAAEAFIQYGYVPTDEERAAGLARSYGYRNTHELRRAGLKIFQRIQRMEDAQARVLQLNEDLLTTQVTGAQIENAVASMERDRMALYHAIEDQANLTAFAFGAATMGDTTTIAVLEAMAELDEHSDTLGLIDFTALREIAQDVQSDDEAARAHAALMRDYDASQGGLMFTATLDEFLDHTGQTFIHSDIAPGPDGVSELEADVNQYVDGLSQRQVDALGLSRDQLKQRLTAAAYRAHARQDQDLGSMMMDTLARTIPEGEEDRARWRENFVTAAAMAGYPEEFAQQTAIGLLDESTYAFQRMNMEITEIRRRSENLDANTNATLEEMGLIPFRQSLLEEQARLTGLQADQLQFELDAAIELTPEGPLLDKELHGMLLANAQAMRAVANDVINSPICRLQGDEFAGRSVLNEDEPMCVAAMADFEAATANIQALNMATLTQDGRYLMHMAEMGDSGVALSNTWTQLEGMEGVNWTRWNELPDEAQYTILSAATLPAGHPDHLSLDDINEHIEWALADLAVAGREAVWGEDVTAARTLSDLNVTSPQWTARPYHERVAELGRTPEWQGLVRRAMDGEQFGTEQAETLARQFGFTVPVGGAELGAFGPMAEAAQARLAESPFGFSLPQRPNISEFREALEMSVEAARHAQEVAPEEQQEYLPPPSGTGQPPARPRFVPAPLGGGAAAQPGLVSGEPQASQVLQEYGIDGTNVRVPEGVDIGPVFDAVVQAESTGSHRGVAGEGVEIGPDDLTRSSAHALGITQIMPETALGPAFGVTPLIPAGERAALWELLRELRAASGQERTELRDRFNQEVESILNDVPVEEFVRFGYEYLAGLLRHYEGDVTKAVAAYNLGHSEVGGVDALVNEYGDQWAEHLPTETRNYVATILRRLQ